MSIIKEFECKRENLVIRGTEFLPDDYENNKYPIMVICHELQANRKTVRPYAKVLAKEGYAVFTFDFCGGSNTSASDGNTTDMSVITEMKDLKAVINYAESLSYTLKDNIVLMGGSQGGFVSAYVAAELKERVKYLILLYPAFCIPHDVRNGYLMQARFDSKNPPEKVNCGWNTWLGKVYITDAINLDFEKDIMNYKGSVLLLHGNADSLVNYDYSFRAYNAYKSAGAKAEYHIIDGADHIFRTKEHFDIAVNYIKKFLQK